MDDVPDPSKIGQETETLEDRGADGRFQPGGPGGPGRRAGSRNAATLLLDELADGRGQALLSKVMEAAESGDMRAADIVLSRIWPIRKGGRTIKLDLPPIDTADDLVKALGALAESVGAGELTPDKGMAVATILETKRRATETVNLEARLAALEQDRK